MRLGWRWARTVIGMTVLGWVGMVGCSSGEAQTPPAPQDCTDSAGDCPEAPPPAPDDAGAIPPPTETPPPGGNPPDAGQQTPPPPPPPGPGDTLWLAREGTAQDDLALDAAVDASGDSFTAAVYGLDDLERRNPTDDKVSLVLTRRSADGETRWQRTFEVRTPETPPALHAGVRAHVAADGTGGLYLAGNVDGVLDFETRELGDTAFVARLDGNGNLVWASTPGAANLTAADVTVDAQGRALVAFNTHGSVDFGNGTRGSGAVVVTYSADGTAEHVLSIGQPEAADATVELSTLAVDAHGRLAVGGRYVGAVRFGNPPVASMPEGSPFLALASPEGTLTWSKALHRAQGSVTSVGIGSEGEVVAAGPFLGTVDWAGKRLQGHAYRYSPFLLSARAGGDEHWGRNLGDGMTLEALAVDASGEVVVGGFTYNRIEDGAAGADGLGSSQPVALRYDAAGAVVATRLYLSDPPRPRGELAGLEAMPAVAVLPGGDALFFGHTDRESDFGSGRHSVSRGDIFLFRVKR